MLIQCVRPVAQARSHNGLPSASMTMYLAWLGMIDYSNIMEQERLPLWSVHVRHVRHACSSIWSQELLVVLYAWN